MQEVLERPVTTVAEAPVVKNKGKVKKVLVICSKGKLEDVYAALVMANGALMEGIQAKMFFTFFGLEAITKKSANSSTRDSPRVFTCARNSSATCASEISLMDICSRSMS